jgi:hypothetical protein
MFTSILPRHADSDASGRGRECAAVRAGPAVKSLWLANAAVMATAAVTASAQPENRRAATTAIRRTGVYGEEKPFSLLPDLCGDVRRRMRDNRRERGAAGLVVRRRARG